MRILITGAHGMLATDLIARLHLQFDLVGISRSLESGDSIRIFQSDLCDLSAGEMICKEKPDLIFHAAAKTNVDGCELHREGAIKDNVSATKNVVEAANKIHSHLIFFSTDYIFDGQKKEEYEETDSPNPLNIYGKTKLLAENYIREHAASWTIFRVSWLYGSNGKSFPRTILERAVTQKHFDIVGDQIGRPTYTKDLANFFGNILGQDSDALHRRNREIYHLANSGTASWAAFAKFIFSQCFGNEISVRTITTSELKRPALRPKNSVLSLAKTKNDFGIRLRDWKEAVLDYARTVEKGSSRCGAERQRLARTVRLYSSSDPPLAESREENESHANLRKNARV